MNKLNNIHIQPIFSSFFCHIKNIEVNHDSIYEYCKKLEYTSTNDKDHSMSKSIFILDDFKEGKNLQKVFLKYINQSVEQLGYVAKSQIVNCWVNKVISNREAVYHMHKNFWLSCVYYPHGSLDDGYKLIFNSDRTNDYTGYDVPVNEYNIFNSYTFSVKVEKGDLIIFPSLVKHKADKHFSKNTRYSIAANILPLGTIGYGEGNLTFT